MTTPKPHRAVLALAKAPAAPKQPPYSLVKRAILNFKGRGVPKAVYRAHAIKWLRMKDWLGARHILLPDAPAKWGRPGDPVVKQLKSPRRLGEQA
jgi:hypothetical protein